MTTEILKQNNFYKTSDLALATTLSLFCPIETLKKINSHKAYFIFKRNKKIDELLDRYWRQELRVEPQLYFNQLKILKARLYASE